MREIDNSEALIEALSRCLGDYFSLDANAVLESLDVGFPPLEVVATLFEFMERNRDEDLGVPGTLVHYVERLPFTDYADMLAASVTSRPTDQTIWMVNRALNSGVSGRMEAVLMKALHEATQDVDALVAEQALQVLARHSGRPSSD